MHRIVLIFLVFVALIVEGSSQTNFVERSKNNRALSQLEWRLSTGNSRILRDISSFLDEAETREQAIDILKRKTIFPTSQIDLNKIISKSDFFDFFYAYQKEIKYSHILHIYYTVPMEQIKREITSAPFASISPMDAFSKLCLDLQHVESEEKLKQNLIALKYVQLHKGVPLNRIFNCLDLENPTVQSGLLQNKSIQYFEADEDLEQIMQDVIIKGENNPVFVNQVYNSVFGESKPRSSISEVKIDLNEFKKQKVSFKDNLTNTLESQYNVSNKYFYNEVDFYGTTLCTKLKPTDNNSSLIANLLATKDPKLLFYLASYVFTTKRKNIDKDVIKLLENLTMVKITNRNEYELATDILIYWAQNYQNYTWDDSVWRFVSEDEKKKQTKNLERLIRRLNSQNDTIAFQAYVAITKGNPYEVGMLVNKYKKVMKKTNPSIPPLRYNYLETTTKIVAYNKEFEISQKVNIPIQNLLDQLDKNTSQKKRFEIENKLLDIAQIKDIPALEYWGLLNVVNKENSFSMGRIIELLFVKYWDQMKTNSQWLTHFIYKAAIFNELDGTGIAKSYSNMIDLKDEELVASINYIKTHSTKIEVMDYIQDELLSEKKTAMTSEKKALAIKAELVEEMKAASEVKYSQINQILDFEESLTTDKEQTLSFLKKLSPAKDIRKLAIKEKLTAEDLSFLKDRSFSHREVGSIMRFFNSEDPKENIKFALDAIADFTIDDKAYVANSLFRYRWFTEYLHNSKFISQELTQIVSILSNYLKESEYIGEIEDRTTQINIIQISLIGRSIEQQLVTSIEIDVDLALKSDLQKIILAKTKFEELGIVLDHVDGLINNKGNLDLSFLSLDFGLPIFDIATNTELNTFLERHKTLSERAFYSIYLEEFGLDFKNNTGELDFEKISKILKYDIAQPFIGKGGGKRDFCVYGLTKILETVFEENLGFESKLNNYQTFVSFSSLNRARAWHSYLEQKGIVKDTADSPSFTH